MKKLKTEYLRLAEPLLDCGFDDLYQRHKKRARQQKRITFSLAAAVSLLLGIAAYSSIASYRTFQNNLMNTYVQKGSELLDQDIQQSLMYFTKALSMNPASQAAETGTLMLLQQNSWLSNTAQIPQDNTAAPLMPQYGRPLNAAEDGSCYSYYDGFTVTFYRPKSESIWQIPVPDKVNPACPEDSVVESTPYAMAISDTRAIIRHAGYLYLYNLEPDGGTSLFAEFDLALVFKEEVRKGNLDLWNETWADSDGRLAVLYNGATAAVINVANTENPCLNAIHTVYGYGLSSVAFSNDGGYYALIYGNDFGIDLYVPGGYVEVYDEYGTMCMATPLDATMVPQGAAFEPNGNRLIVWGSGILQIWDITTGSPAVAPIKLEKIVDASWTDDGLIAVRDGSNSTKIYTPMQFVTSPSEPPSIPTIGEPDSHQTEFRLSNGFLLKHNYSNIWLEDGDGNQIGDDISASINKMYACSDSEIAYFWYDNSDTLIRVAIKDHRSGLSAQTLDASGFSINDLKAVPGGLIAFAGNDCMLFYPHDSISPKHIMTFSKSGNMDSAAAAESGLLAVVLKSTQYYTSASHNFQYQYTLELWDLNTGLLVARPVIDEKYRIQDLSLSNDGWLSYQQNNSTCHYLVSLPDADSTTVQDLLKIPCQRILQEDATALQSSVVPVFSGNWKDSIHTESTPSGEAETGSTVQAYLSELDALLEAEGAGRWFERYQEIWTALDSAPLPLNDMCGLFRDYVRTARDHDLLEQLEPGFSCMTNAFIADGGRDRISKYSFTLQTTQYMLQTQEYDDIMIDYWLKMASIEEDLLDPNSEDWFLDFVSVYEQRLYAALLLGYEADAFFAAIDEAYHDSLSTILIEGNFDTLFYMVTGKPKNAAEAYSQYLNELQELYAYDQEKCIEETEQAVMFLLWDLNILEQRSILAEADICQFIDDLPLTVGITLRQVTPANLRDGLYLGDVITAVDGVRIFNQYHVKELMEKYPTAALTVKRGKQSLVTPVVENWLISGDFYAR